MIDALLQTVEDRRDDCVALTADLVRIPSVNPPGSYYRPCIDLVGERLAKRDFALTFVRAEGAPGDTDDHPRWNLIARREGRSSGPTVHFNSHVDVVSPGEDWSQDPFGAAVIDGKLHGRGSCDMKGGLASSIVAAEAVIDTFPDFSGAIEISATADEESGGFAGVAYLCETGLISRDRVDHVIIPEPFHRDLVCIGHRGVLWSEIVTKGRIAHGCMPFLGDSASLHMAAFITALENDLLPAIQTRETELPIIPAAARRASINLALLRAGTFGAGDDLPTPVVPDRATLVLDRRYLPEEDIDQVEAELDELIGKVSRQRPNFAATRREIMHFPPVMTEITAPTVRAASAAIETVYGKPARLVASPGTYDHKHFATIAGITDCIAYGPGQLDLAHQPDEYVEIEDLVGAAKVMAVSLAMLLGIESR